MRLDSSVYNVSQPGPHMDYSWAVLNYSNRAAWAEKPEMQVGMHLPVGNEPCSHPFIGSL